MGKSFRSPSKVARRLMLMPLAARKIANWPGFMSNYALGLVPSAPYLFRNRAQLKIGRGVDHVPIIEIFLREEYGAVADGAVILDLGANIGTFSIYAATTARDVTIYAYEPMPDFFRLMEENVRLNGFEGAVKCFNSAVGGDARDRELFIDGTDFFFPTLLEPDASRVVRTIRVPCTTLVEILDSNNLARVDLVKMDCEGAEYEILYNTPLSYLNRIGEMRMEYHNLDGDRSNVDALAAFLTERGYDIVRSRPTSSTNGNLWARKHA
jgi:FkbM family methyltransferase